MFAKGHKFLNFAAAIDGAGGIAAAHFFYAQEK